MFRCGHRSCKVILILILGIGLLNLYIFTSPSSSSNDDDDDGDYIESKKLHLFIGSSSTTSTLLLQINNNQIEIDPDQKRRSLSPTTAKSSTSSTTEHTVSDQTTHEQTETLISDVVSVNMTGLSSSNTTEKTPGQSEVEARIADRMRGIKEQCQKENYPTTGQYNMYYFNKFTVSWCPVFKASSSTWRDFFIDEMTPPDALFAGEHYHLWVLKSFLMTRSNKLSRGGPRKRSFSIEPSDSLRFTVVRNPLSRLISHLLKAQNYPNQVKVQRDQWVQESIFTGRTNRSWDGATKARYTREWNIYISEIDKVETHSPFSADNPYLNPPYPLFGEMVDFISKHRTPVVDNKGANGHWRPAFEWCDICQNEFDYIIKLEEEPEELLYLLEQLNLTEYKDRFLSRHNPSGKKSATQNEILKYVNQLNSKQKSFINLMFKRDFKYLGYDPIDLEI